MTIRRSLLILLACMMVSTPCAQEEEATPLTAEVELGAVNTSGNTDAQSINFRGEFDWGREQWEYGFLIDGLRSSGGRILAAHRFTTWATSTIAWMKIHSFSRDLLMKMIVSAAMTASQISRSTMVAV